MDDLFRKPSEGPLPARGAAAGIKADVLRARQQALQGDVDKRDPRGVGVAWSHNFLNQKPWHPMNFRNQIKKFEAEQKHVKDQKDREKAQAEFDAEQEYLKTLSYLGPGEQQRYKEVQSVSFMYTKPPGYDAAMARDAEVEKKKAADAAQQQAALEGGTSAAAAAAGPGPSSILAAQGKEGVQMAKPDEQQEQRVIVDRIREDPYAGMLAARHALHNNSRLAVRQPDVGAHGGFETDAANQQLLGDDDGGGQGPVSELDVILSLPADQQVAALKRLAKRRKKEQEEAQLREAEAVLRAAGFDVDNLATAAEDGSRHGKGKDKSKDKSKSKKSKKKHGKDKAKKEKGEKRRRRRGSSGSGSSSDSE